MATLKEDLMCNKKNIQKFSSDTGSGHFGWNYLTPKVDKSPITDLYFGIVAPCLCAMHIL